MPISFALCTCLSVHFLSFDLISVLNTILSIKIILFVQNTHFPFLSLNYYCQDSFHFLCIISVGLSKGWVKTLSYKTKVYVFCSLNWIKQNLVFVPTLYQKWHLFLDSNNKLHYFWHNGFILFMEIEQFKILISYRAGWFLSKWKWHQNRIEWHSSRQWQTWTGRWIGACIFIILNNGCEIVKSSNVNSNATQHFIRWSNAIQWQWYRRWKRCRYHWWIKGIYFVMESSFQCVNYGFRQGFNIFTIQYYYYLCDQLRFYLLSSIYYPLIYLFSFH